MRVSRVLGWAALSFVLASTKSGAQAHPQGALSGRVTDPDGLAVAGVEVTADSPAIQRQRETATSASGEFMIPFLPPGEYEVVFRHAGWRELRMARPLRVGERARVDVQLEMAEVAASIEVQAGSGRVVGGAAGVTATFNERLLERLPVEKGWLGALDLAPGATRTAPGGGVNVSGSVSFETSYVMDGAVVNGTLGGQPRPFAIEDAIEEIAVHAAGVSAEYGRFTGGVVELVTRSGGDAFHGSARTSLQNDAWRQLTPYERSNFEEDPRVDDVVPSYSATLGGPLRRQRLWFFAAGREEDVAQSRLLSYTDLPYRHELSETRAELKLTWSPSESVTLRVRGGTIDSRETNASAFGPMDYASLYDFEVPEDLLAIDATAMLADGLFLEAQLSARRHDVVGAGARTTDLLQGTTIVDLSSGAPFHSPWFCAVCGASPGELNRDARGNRNAVLKASGFWSRPGLGSHDAVAGAEIYEDHRRNDNWQSGSGYTIDAGAAILRDGELYPVFLPAETLIEWRPIFETSKGSRLRTYSAYFNDLWRLGQRWTLNLGLRWDKNDSRDQAGTVVSDRASWSPRLAVAWDPRGDGAWSVDAGFGRYVAALASLIGDEGSTAGRAASFIYEYDGPPINEDTEAEDLLSADQALALLFDWFFSNGGADRPFAVPPFIPGLTRHAGPGLRSPSVDEYRLGVGRRLGDRGMARLDAVWREFRDQYAERVDTTTGKVADPRGRLYDLRLIENSDRVERSYAALDAQLEYRFRRDFQVGFSYTLAKTRGNFDGDNRSPNGGAAANREVLFYPEYGQPGWRSPVGDLGTDQRHKGRLWATWDWRPGGGRGTVEIGAVVRYDSGLAYGLEGVVAPRPYVSNPGYETPPRQVPYFFGPRGGFHAGSATASDLSLGYTLQLGSRGMPEVFARIIVVNAFGEAAQTGPGLQGVLTSLDDEVYAPFDPFTEQPVRGSNWDRVADFGLPEGPDDYQQPRTFTATFGLRF